ADVQSIFGMVDRLTANLASTFLPEAERPTKGPEIEQASTSNVEAYKHYQLGLDYGRRFLTADAMKELNEAVRLDPQFALAMLELSSQYSLAGDSKNSQEFADRAEQLQSRLPRFEQLSLQATNAKRTGDLDAAVQAYRQLVTEYPRDGYDRGSLATYLSLVGKVDEAVATLKEGLATSPKDENLLNFDIYALAEAGDMPGAMAADDAYEAVRPGDPNPFDSRGDALFFAGKYEEAVSAYRAAEGAKDGFNESPKLMMVYSEERKPDMAKVALQRFASGATALRRLYVPVFEAQFAQNSGDVEGAIGKYRDACKGLAAAGQYGPAGQALMDYARLSILLGQTSQALTYVQQQKLNGDELQALALLQTVSGNREGAAQSWQRFGATHPRISPRVIGFYGAAAEAWSAIVRGDAAQAGAAAEKLPDWSVRNFLYLKGNAALLNGDYATAAKKLDRQIAWGRDMQNFGTMTVQFPIVPVLARFYLAEAYEKQGKRDQALNEYQEFLSHFETSHTKLPQVEQARAELKKLMQ
ncbi:MAG TPA: tetratricopeptide repeat protein, partial [Candidatus Koribacter sp.]